MSFADFLSGYTACALWCGVHEVDEDGNDIDAEYGEGDLAPETLREFEAECRDFYEANHEHIEAGCMHWNPAEGNQDAYGGHDFWLTRNGHGAGFWDGDYREPYATMLTDMAKAYGSTDLYVGDDGLIYQHP